MKKRLLPLLVLTAVAGAVTYVLAKKYDEEKENFDDIEFVEIDDSEDELTSSENEINKDASNVE